MSVESNIRTVQDCYARFGAGDIPGVLAHLADDVAWVDPGEPDVPHAGRRTGRSQVAQFFAGLAETQSFASFTPRQFVAQGDVVVALGHMAGTSKITGKAWESDWAMAWTFRGDKVARYQAYTDTNALAKAARR